MMKHSNLETTRLILGQGSVNPASYFCKSSLVGTQPHLLVYELPIPAFALQWQGGVAAQRPYLTHKTKSVYRLAL